MALPVLLSLALLFLALSQGCSKDPAPQKTVPPRAPEAVALPEVPKAPVMARTTRKLDDSAATLLRYLPRDSSVVLGLNWSKARYSNFVRSFDKDFIKAFPKIETVKSSCGIDALEVVHAVAVGLGPDPSNDDEMVFAMSGNFNRESVEACALRNGGKIDGNRYGSTANVYWPTPNVVVVSKGKSTEELALVPSASAWDNNKLMLLVDSLDLRAVVWAAGLIPASASASFSSMGAAPWGGHLTVDIIDDMRFALGLEFDSEADAQSLQPMLEMGLGMGKSQPGFEALMRNVNLERVGQTITVSGDVAEGDLKDLTGVFKRLF